MTRKSKKGITGKAMPTSTDRYHVGPGIDFVDNTLTDGDKIKVAVKKAEKDMGLR